MARGRTIITGDRELTRWLNKLEKNTAAKLHRTASRQAAHLVLKEAKGLVHRDRGLFRRSLTVRSLPKSRTRMGHMVTQRLNYMRPSKTIPGGSAYYGVFQELGWTPAKRKNSQPSSIPGPKPKKGVSTRTVKGKWPIRRAGVQKEKQAIQLYHQRLRQLLEGGT